MFNEPTLQQRDTLYYQCIGVIGILTKGPTKNCYFVGIQHSQHIFQTLGIRVLHVLNPKAIIKYYDIYHGKVLVIASMVITHPFQGSQQFVHVKNNTHLPKNHKT